MAQLLMFPGFLNLLHELRYPMKIGKEILASMIGVIGLMSIDDAKAQAPGWFTRIPPAESGLTDSTSVHFVAVGDVNNDGYPDLLLMYSNQGIYAERKPLKLYLNVQKPNSSNPKDRWFIDATAQSAINMIPSDTGQNANIFTMADFNNDGNLDLVTGIYFHRIESYPNPNDRARVYLGDGTGKFTLKPNNGITELGLINFRAFTTLDFNRDGKLDIFIPTWFKDYTNNVWDHARLMKGNGDGTFEDVTIQSGINNHPEPMYGSAAFDWNNDCLPDIFTAPYCRTGGQLFRNEGDGTFSSIGKSVGYDLQRIGDRQASCTFAVYPEDVNNDGNMDMFLAVVHGGNGQGQFRSTVAINKGPDHNYEFEIDEKLLPVSPPASSHRGDYDAIFVDFENDGRKDIIMTQSTYMPATDRTYFWHQQSDGSFKDATTALGLLVPQLKNSLGIEVFDFDLDGDEDFVILGTSGTYFDLWRNNAETVTGNNYVTVDLNPDPKAGINSSAIGARVFIYYDGKMQMKEVMAGRGMHAGQQPFKLNFGVGTTKVVDSMVIRWPDAECSKSVYKDVKTNEVTKIVRFPEIIADKNESLSAVKLYPNPTERYVIVQQSGITNRMADVRLMDAVGRTVSIVEWFTSDSDKIIVDLEKVPTGSYFLHLLDENGGTEMVHKIIKN